VIYTLDTNAMIDIVNSRRGVRERYDEAVRAGGEIVASSLASHELIYGALISPRPDEHLRRAERLLVDVKIVPIEQEDGLAAAELRRELRLQGRPIGGYDLIIAGQAMARGWTVVSNNLSEYERVPKLKVVDWVDPAPA